MSVDLKNAFRLSFVTGETALPIPPASEILARLRSGPVWDGASIALLTTSFLFFKSSGTRAMDSSSSATKMSRLGAPFCSVVFLADLRRSKYSRPNDQALSELPPDATVDNAIERLVFLAKIEGKLRRARSQ